MQVAGHDRRCRQPWRSPLRALLEDSLCGARRAAPEKRTAPSRTVETEGRRGEFGSIQFSVSRDTEHVEQSPFEAECARARSEIGAHPGRLELALDRAVAPLAAILEGEELAGR